MPQNIFAETWSKTSTSERSAFRAIAGLFRQFPDHICLSDVDVAVRLRELGLSQEQAGVVGSLIRLAGPRIHIDVDDGVFAPPETCPINWRPTILTPVFYGRQIFEPNNCLPALTRVYYPSLEGSPQNAPMLELCGKYPLILFLHGHCFAESNYVYRWERHLSQLARCGFVVAAPYLPGISHGPQDDITFDMVLGVLRWMRREWSGRSNLLPSTGMCGHSYGGMVACRVAVAKSAACFAGLSAGWEEWPDYGTAPIPLNALNMPSLHMWGTAGSRISDAIPDPQYASIALPKHKVVLSGGDHFIYLQGQTGGCSSAPADCHLLGAIAGDLLAGFFAHYLPPSELQEAGAAIPLSLVPPQIDLTFDQQFYAGAHLGGLEGLRYADKSCKIPVSWETSSSTGHIVLQGSV